MKPTVGRLLADAACDLAAASSLNDARREAQILLGATLGVTRAWISAHWDDRVAPYAADTFGKLVRRRQAGEPIAYLVGKREFYGLEFYVTPDVLIPRADTETLVDVALEKLEIGTQGHVLDLGTGSGCVALTIARERPASRITAVDISGPALAVARQNAEALGLNAEFLQGEWFSELDGRRFDMIVANPPYVAVGDPHLRNGDLRFEPAVALASGCDGLGSIRAIVAAAPGYLNDGGWLLFEHGYDQAAVCRDLLHDSGFSEVGTRTDLAGLPRVSGGRLLTQNSPNR